VINGLVDVSIIMLRLFIYLFIYSFIHLP